MCKEMNIENQMKHTFHQSYVSKQRIYKKFIIDRLKVKELFKTKSYESNLILDQCFIKELCASKAAYAKSLED